MTEHQTLHLIEQFAAQAPFAVWITDSRGVTIFANKKIHALFGIPEHPSGALGRNLFDDPSIAQLKLEGVAYRQRHRLFEQNVATREQGRAPSRVVRRAVDRHGRRRHGGVRQDIVEGCRDRGVGVERARPRAPLRIELANPPERAAARLLERARQSQAPGSGSDERDSL